MDSRFRLAPGTLGERVAKQRGDQPIDQPDSSRAACRPLSSSCSNALHMGLDAGELAAEGGQGCVARRRPVAAKRGQRRGKHRGGGSAGFAAGDVGVSI